MPTTNVSDAELFAVLKAASRLLVAAGRFAECTNASSLMHISKPRQPPSDRLRCRIRGDTRSRWEPEGSPLHVDIHVWQELGVHLIQ